MKVLILSWEFPPQVFGGLGRHVYELSTALVGQGVQPYVLTPRVAGCPDFEKVNGVFIYRTGTPVSSQDEFKSWTFGMNGDLIREGIRLSSLVGGFDIIHAHDWLVAYAGRSLSRTLEVPLVSTIHATEYGRNLGLHNRMQKEIHDVEYNLVRDSDWVICCSEYMRNEISELFARDGSHIDVIPNGVSFSVQPENLFGECMVEGIDEGDRVIFYIGRLVPEKGVTTLIKAFHKLVYRIPSAKLLIGGKGPQEKYLKSLAAELNLANQVIFTGFVTDDLRDHIYKWAEVAVFPSMYEPFGIVALEAMAADTPVIVSDVGGLAEIVEHRVTGLKVPPSDTDALTAALIELMTDPDLAQTLKTNAVQMIEHRFSWKNIAAETRQIYERVIRA